MPRAERAARRPKTIEVCSVKYPIAKKDVLRRIGAKKGDSGMAATLRRLMDQEIAENQGEDFLRQLDAATA